MQIRRLSPQENGLEVGPLERDLRLPQTARNTGEQQAGRCRRLRQWRYETETHGWTVRCHCGPLTWNNRTTIPTLQPSSVDIKDILLLAPHSRLGTGLGTYLLIIY